MNRTRIAALAAIALAALTACGGSSDADSGADSPAESGAASGPVTIEYLGWVTGLDESIKTWNAANPDVQVTLTTVPGSVEGNTLIRNGVQAGNAPCLSQMAYASISSFVADDLLQPVTEQASTYKDDYLDWTWSQASPGGETYGIPQDTGPMVLFYNKTEFDKYGIAVPTTWDEYAAASATVHAADPSVSLGFHGTDDVGNWAGLASQAGAKWFAIDGQEWKVGFEDAPTVQLADYWQGLVDREEVRLTPRFDAGIYPLFADGKILSMIGASWNYASLPANVPDQAGQWRVAQLPTWGGEAASGNSGGSASVVLKGCEHPAEAVEFAHWLNSSEDSLNVLSAPDKGGLYPAAEAALEFDVVNQDVAFYGDQNIYEEFAASAAKVDTSWVFGPTWDGTNATMTDGFSAIAAGSSNFPKLQTEAQASTLEAMTSRGISASAAG